MDSILRGIDREQMKMQSDIDNLNRHYGKLAGFLHQYIQESVSEWARLAVNHPLALLLIVETTRIVDEQGYAVPSGQSEPIRFAALQLATGHVRDLLFHPTHSEAITGTEYHGLTMADLTGKPKVYEAWSSAQEMLEGKHIIIFGAEWARLALQPASNSRILDGAFCLQNKCKEYYGEFYDLSLERVLSYQAIDKKREDLRDSRERILMLAQVMHNLAEGMPKQDEPFDPAFVDLDAHPF